MMGKRAVLAECLCETFGRRFQRRFESFAARFENVHIQADVDVLDDLPYGLEVRREGRVVLAVRAATAKELMSETKARAGLLSLQLFAE